MNLEYKFNFNFEVSEPKQKNNIVFFALSSMEKTHDDFLSFPTALNKNLVDVEEVNNKGFIGKLKITNKSNQKLLILDSENILGTRIRQNRVVSTTVLIPEYASVLIPVFCSEQNRWSSSLSQEDIKVSESLYFSKGRENNFSDIYHSNSKQTNQHERWSEISDKLDEFKTKSFTSSIDEIYKKRKSNIEEIVRQLQPEKNQVGVALGIGSQLVSLDIFSSNEMFKIYLPRLIRSTALDSFKKTYYKSCLKKKDVHKILRLVKESSKQIHQVVSGTLGNEIRFNNELISGSMLCYKDKIVHFSVFLKEQEAKLEYEYEVA